MLKIVSVICMVSTIALGAAFPEDASHELRYRQFVENFKAGEAAYSYVLSKDFMQRKEAPENMDDFSEGEEVSAYLLAFIETKNLNGLVQAHIKSRANNIQARAQDWYVYGRLLQELGQYEQAAIHFQAVVKSSFTPAVVNLGARYVYGRGVKRNYREAESLFRLAADQGYASAQFSLGCMYLNGYGVERDDKEAVRLYRLAANQGYAPAQYNLGLMCRQGRGVDQDYKEAVRLYRLAAEQGHADAQINLGLMYEEGRGVEKNDEEAMCLYRLAAEQGNSFALMKLRRAACTIL